jgi:succinate dehydrogenase/fumarate reductase flavoprotein subunit
MGTAPQFVQIDPAAEATQLANLFNRLSRAVDDFRLDDHDPPIPADQLARLKDEAQALEDRAHHFTAEAIGATLQSIQGDLAQIKAVTAQAKEQLAKLNEVSKVISIATSVLSVGTAIAAGNPASILAAAQALAQAVAT